LAARCRWEQTDADHDCEQEQEATCEKRRKAALPLVLPACRGLVLSSLLWQVFYDERLLLTVVHIRLELLHRLPPL